MRSILFSLLLAMLSCATLSSQKILKPVVVTYKDGSVVHGKMQSPDFESLKHGFEAELEGEKVKLSVKDLRSLVIDGSEKYEVVDGKVLQVLAEGDVTMYVAEDSWMYLQKDSEEMLRLENHYLRMMDTTVVSIDTIYKEENSKAGTWKVKRDYYYGLSKLFVDKGYAVPSKIRLSPSSIKAQVKKYNKLNPQIEPQSYFEGTGFMYLYGGARTFSDSEESHLISADYYLEVGDNRTSKHLSFYASYRPSFMRHDRDFVAAEAGIRVRILKENKFEPFLKVGTALALENVDEDDVPDKLQLAAGLRYYITRRLGIEASVSANNTPGFRLGLVGKVF